MNLSASGANSWSEFSISSQEISCPVCAAIRPMEVATLASTPRLTSFHGLSLRIASMSESHSFWYGLEVSLLCQVMFLRSGAWLE